MCVLVNKFICMRVSLPQYLWDLYMYLVYHTPHVANVSGFYICYCIYCYFNYTTVLHFKLWHSIYDCLQSHVRLGFSVIEISTFRQKRNDKNPRVTSTHLSLKYICDSCYMHFVSLNIYVTAVILKYICDSCNKLLPKTKICIS